MSNQHPITPPPELINEWYDQAPYDSPLRYVAARAAQWGADQELNACCEWLANGRSHSLTWEEVINYSSTLRIARRPKPTSLAEEAEGALLHLLDGAAHSMDTTEPAEYIRRALERLQELEGGNG